MKFYPTFIIAVSLIFLLLNSCTEGPSFIPTAAYECNQEGTNDHPDVEAFQAFLDAKAVAGFPGISMLLETPEGTWSGASGQADIYNAIDMEACHPHLIGSVTKVFTAVLVHQLFISGELSSTEEIAPYLNDEIVRRLSNVSSATVGDLLRHTSGIPELLDLPFSLAATERPRKVFTAEELLQEAYGFEAVFPAGTKIAYSNTNYVLLELILERVTGQRGAALYQDRIFAPLGMDDTYFNQNGEIPTGISRAYYDRYEDGRLIDVTETNAIRGSMAGGIVSTTEDLKKFMDAVVVSDGAIGGVGLASLLFQPDLPFAEPDDFEFEGNDRIQRILGFGSGLITLETTEGKAIGFNGGYQGRKARMWYWPESEKLIIYFINGSRGVIDEESRRLFRTEMVELLFDF